VDVIVDGQSEAMPDCSHEPGENTDTEQDVQTLKDLRELIKDLLTPSG
jgi:hypothetical protein